MLRGPPRRAEARDRFLSRFFLGFALGLVTAIVPLLGVGHFLAVTDETSTADAIVALSGDSGARMRTAVQLWHEKRAPVIVFAGSSLDPESLSSAEIMKREAVRLGVPAEAVLVEPSSATTEENAVRVADLLAARKLTRVILVTSPYHQRRAAILFGRQFGPAGISFTNHPARDEAWDPTWWWTREPSRTLTLVELSKLAVEVASGPFRRS